MTDLRGNLMEVVSFYEYAKANAYLLNFDDHNEFLMTYASERDKCYIDHEEALLQILSLGYRYDNYNVAKLTEFLRVNFIKFCISNSEITGF